MAANIFALNEPLRNQRQELNLEALLNPLHEVVVRARELMNNLQGNDAPQERLKEEWSPLIDPNFDSGL